MTKGQVIGLGLSTLGIGIVIYVSFFYKFSDGLTLIPHLSGATTDPKAPVGGKTSGGTVIAPAPKPASVTSSASPPPTTAKTPLFSEDHANGAKPIYSLVDGLNIRPDGSTTSTPIGTVNKGELIGYILLEKPLSNTDWVGVSTKFAPSVGGYVFRKYVTL